VTRCIGRAFVQESMPYAEYARIEK